MNNTEELKVIIRQAVQEALPQAQEVKATMTLAQCAKYSGIGTNKLLELAHSQHSDFPCFKVGSKFLVNKLMLDMWLEKITNEGRVL